MNSAEPVAETTASDGAPASPTDAQWGIVSGDFVETGGMDVANLHLARYLAAEGGVEVVTHRAAPLLADHRHSRIRLVPRPFGKHLLGQRALQRAGRQLAEELLRRGGRFIANGGNCDAGDINWVHYVHAAYQPVQTGGPARKLKSLYHHRSCLQSERQAIRRACRVICNSQLTARHVIELLGADESKVSVVYYGTDPQRFPNSATIDQQAARAELGRTALGWEGRPWVVFVGALGDRRKGFDTLYESWRVLAAGGQWDAGLVVVGAGAELPAWRRRVAEDGLGDSVRLLGFRKDVPTILAASDVLVHPARYEAYGLGVHEALCMGLPVIPTAGCGVVERLAADLADLTLPPAVTPEQLADQLRHWRDRLETWPAKARATSERLRQHTWDAMSREFVAQATIGESRGGSP